MNLNPEDVLNLRIRVSKLGIIKIDELVSVGGCDLIAYMFLEGIPKARFDQDLSEYWNCRDLARWMAAHPKLFDLYVQGKAMVNPSGRTCEINQGY